MMPLHGGKGGPLRCPLCVGQWNAQHGRRRRAGRIVIRAIMAFLDAGGRYDDINNLKLSAATSGGDFLGIHCPEVNDPLGYMDGIARLDGADVELTSELLADVLQLTHPDRHAPEHKALAGRVTQSLLAIKPFVFPAPKPKQVVSPKPGKDINDREPIKEKAPRARFPCSDCADTTPYYYCDECRGEYDKREREKDEKRREKRRQQYARRGKMWTPPRDKSTPKPRSQRQAVITVNQDSCESLANQEQQNIATANQFSREELINHRLSGLQAAILVAALTKRVEGGRGCDVSRAELLAEIWGWKSQCAFRWTAENSKNNKNCRAGDTRPEMHTRGSFSHIPPYMRRRASASLSRALSRLEKRSLISFVGGTWGTYSGGPVLTPQGEQVANRLAGVDHLYDR